jgi:predicted signal transduction protein with EAL and GGDEF domain
LGGDEFTVILEELPRPEVAGKVAEKILTHLSNPFKVKDDELITISASMGIRTYPKDGEEVEELIKKADAAMYEAKKRGKNAYHFFTDQATALKWNTPTQVGRQKSGTRVGGHTGGCNSHSGVNCRHHPPNSVSTRKA